MFCDKCGKSNVSGIKRCRYCGADMPEISGDNGFSDILSFKPEETVAPVAEASVYAQEPVYQTPVEDYSYTSRTTLDTSQDKKIKFYGLIAICISVILFTSAIGICVATKVASDKAEDRIEKREEEIEEREEKIEAQEKKEKKEKAEAKKKAEEEAKKKAEEARKKAEEEAKKKLEEAKNEAKAEAVEKDKNKVNPENVPTLSDKEEPRDGGAGEIIADALAPKTQGNN